MGSREELVARSIPLLQKVKDMTPGAEMKRCLNEKYGEENQLYQGRAFDSAQQAA